eukprot:2221165-Prymnesium_polylepis.3
MICLASLASAAEISHTLSDPKTSASRAVVTGYTRRGRRNTARQCTIPPGFDEQYSHAKAAPTSAASLEISSGSKTSRSRLAMRSRGGRREATSDALISVTSSSPQTSKSLARLPEEMPVCEETPWFGQGSSLKTCRENVRVWNDGQLVFVTVSIPRNCEKTAC